jgi:hypothetical protein
MISHLDDEQVSAALDGEATPGEAAHLETCEACRARLDAFRDVSREVGTPVPSDLIARETAIAAALTPEMLASEMPRRRPPVATWLAAAAAAVIALAVAVPLLSSSSSSKKATSTALSPSATSPLAKGAASATPTALGEQSDPTALAAVVRQRLTTQRSTAASKSAAPAAGNFQNPSTDQSNAPEVACANEAAAAVGQAPSELRYQATLTWKGRLAVVMVFGPDPHPAAVVITQPACDVLATLPL